MRKTLFHILLSLLLILLAHTPSVIAQKQTLSGQIIDKVTLQGIPNANIVILGTSSGCSTNSNGEFSLSPDTLPVNLIISHISYETQRVWIEKKSGHFTVMLKPVMKMLDEVEVTSEHVPVAFFRDDKYSVLDYEVDNDLVYLLIYKYRLNRSELICRTIFGDTVASSGMLSFKPSGLFLDCLGSLHALSADSAYQIFLVDDELKAGYVYSLEKFRSTLLNCVASTDEWLYFRSASRDHLTVDFYQVNRHTSKKQDLASVSDREMLTVLRQNPQDYYYLMMDTIPEGGAMFEWVWVKKIMYKPNVSILHLLGDSLAVFNTSEAALYLYDLTGKYLSGVNLPVNEAGEGAWTKEVYVDDFAHQTYTSFLKNGQLTFYSIDSESGKLHRIIKTTHSFPQKVRFCHNHLFYLYDVPGEGDNKQLFRQKL